jgi:hypothetical protein
MKTNYENQNLEESIYSSLNELLQKAEAKFQAIGARNYPMLENDSYAAYFEDIHLEHQKLIDKINSFLHPKVAYMQAAQATQKANRENHTVTNKVLPLKSRLIEVVNGLKAFQLSPKTKLATKLLIGTAIAIICCADGIFNTPTFLAWGLVFYEALALGVIFGGVLTLYAHIIPWIISLGKTIWQKRLIVAGLVILTFGMFWYLGEMRADYLSDSAREDGLYVHFSPLPFALASVVLLLIAIALPIIYYPSDEEREIKRRYDALAKEKQQIEKELKGIDEKIEDTADQKDAIHQESGSRLERGFELEQNVIANGLICFSSIKKTNLLHREDKQKPSCYNEPYPFTWRTYFNIDGHHQTLQQ